MNNSTTSVPTPEQEQRAKWDLLLLDLELRSEQLRHFKQYQTDLTLLGIELRTQQVIQMKRFETWKALATLITAGVATGSAIAAAILWTAHIMHVG